MKTDIIIHKIKKQLSEYLIKHKNNENNDMIETIGQWLIKNSADINYSTYINGICNIINDNIFDTIVNINNETPINYKNDIKIQEFIKDFTELYIYDHNYA